MSERDGAAARRRARRLSTWHRHERLTVAMGLATAIHHSVQHLREWSASGTKRCGARSLQLQGRGRLAGATVGAVTAGYVAAPAPLLAAPVVASGDGPHASALAFLVRQAVLAQEEKEKRVKEGGEEEGREGGAREDGCEGEGRGEARGGRRP